MKTNKKGISAAAFMASFSSAGRDITPTSPKPSNHPQFTVVERWNGQKWTEVRLEWNGTEYREPRVMDAMDYIDWDEGRDFENDEEAR